MQPVPMPQILDPERLQMPERDDMRIEDHRAQTASVRHELTRTCEYAQALWHTLEAVRQYLVDSLPSEPDAEGGVSKPSTSPTGKDDEDGWTVWEQMYGAVTSSLAGATGDSGYGAEEARVIAQHRRV
ncbi:hypothetical protein [uncultured Jatrophihabitans sp.]|uniref:hypothetical protein n=1 Tax=uncultured Jatrophihabitans sp. TaxID=1610747 RepID=UPI0035CC3BD8